MNPLDIQALQAFVAVAEQSSFSVAADKLHLTQPAVSKRIALLESQIDKPLFDRIRKRIFITKAGELLLPRARAILQQIEQTQQMLQDMEGVVAGTLSIAFSHHIGLHRLPPFLKRFSQQFPNVTFDIRFVDSEQAYDLILSGECELAVITLTPDTSDAISSTRLWRDPLVFVCSPEHQLHLKDHVTLAQLSEYDAILPTPESFTGNVVREAFQKQDLDIKLSMSTNYLETIKMIVSIGLGWSVLPKTMASSLEIIHTPDIYIERDLGVIEYKGRQLSNAAREFKNLLAEES